MPKLIKDWEKGNNLQRKHLQDMADAINDHEERLKNIGKNQNLPLVKFIGCDERAIETVWWIPARKGSL